MRLIYALVLCCSVAACTGGGQDAEDYVPPQPAAEASSGVSLSGYARVGVEKGG